MRSPLVIANWKMNHNAEETIKFFARFSRPYAAATCAETVVCPPFTSLYSLSVMMAELNSPISLGAQNCHFEESGAYTGEVSPLFLKELAVKYVLVGHSERRRLFGETDDSLARKLNAVLRQKMTPVFCVGETKEIREQNQTKEWVLGQLEKGLEAKTPAEMSHVVIAYEPVWAIGTGLNATPEQAQEVHLLIRQWLSEKFSPGVASALRILYGGSVNKDNAGTLMKMPDIDGLLVGGASLEVDSLLKIVQDAGL